MFGDEVNHWSVTNPDDIAKSGLAIAETLLKMGCGRFPWEREKGYPTNLIQGDFRNSIRAIGNDAAERRKSRIRLWRERGNFDIPHREMPTPTTTVARVRYFGNDLPIQFALCLHMRHSTISGVTLLGKDIPFETFNDGCSTFAYIPLVASKPGTITLTLNHPKY